MTKKILILAVIILFLVVGYIVTIHQNQNNVINNSNQPQPIATVNTTSTNLPLASQLLPPISQAAIRITKKPFGIKVSPQNSPVQPERFSGYHTGVDFETFPSEANIDVPVMAITGGKIIYQQWVSGYGGVVIQSGTINGQTVTILYGHLNISSVKQKIGDTIAAGDQIAVLGQGHSRQTDGERKHLHLGIHLGTKIDLLGYIQNQTELSGWLDWQSLVK